MAGPLNFKSRRSLLASTKVCLATASITILCGCLAKTPPPAPTKIAYTESGWLQLTVEGKDICLLIAHDGNKTGAFELAFVSCDDGAAEDVLDDSLKMKSLGPALAEWTMHKKPGTTNVFVGQPSNAEFLTDVSVGAFELRDIQFKDRKLGQMRFGYRMNPYHRLTSTDDLQAFIFDGQSKIPKAGVPAISKDER